MTRHYNKCPVGEEHRTYRNASPADVAFACLSDLSLYHWSPRARRNQIQRRGLVPGSNSLQGDWKPPYVCFSDDAGLAWALSGAIHPEIEEWDLWQCYPEDVEQWEIILDTYASSGRHYIKEYRVYHRVFKRHVHYIGSRSKKLLETLPA